MAREYGVYVTSSQKLNNWVTLILSKRIVI